MEENSRNQILANELVRRLGNTDTRQSSALMGEVVDQFSKKILTSGYNLKQVRKISINGIRGWERKLEKSKKRG